MGNVYKIPPTPTQCDANSDTSDNLEVSLLANKKEYDLFRDSWVRYIGYSNEVGEAFRRYISRKLLITSYAMATSYVCADTIHKAHRSISKDQGTSQALINAGDAFVWQMFASVLIPGYVINRITYWTRRLVRLKRKKCICKASPIVRYTPVAVGLLAIPFVIHPIDESVTWIMDKTLRVLYREPEDDAESDGPSNSSGRK